MDNTTTPVAARKLRARPALIAALVLAGWIGGYWMAASWRDQQKFLLPVVAESALNFGEVWEDQAFRWELPVQNRGLTQLRVTEFASNCACLSIEPPMMEIEPGETRSAQLKLDLSYRTNSADANKETSKTDDGQVRTFTLRIAAKVQTGNGTMLPSAVWTIWGKVRPVLTVDPRAITFGDSLIVGQPRPTRSLKIRTYVALDELRGKCDPDCATVQVSQFPDDRSNYIVTIRPGGELKAGSWKTSIVLEPRTAKESLPRVVIPAEARVLEDIQTTPVSISFGAHRLGQMVHETIVLRSWRGAHFEVARVECEGKDLTASPMKMDPALKEYRVMQRITALENQRGGVRFHVRAAGSEVQVLTVPVNYFGTAD